MEIYRWTKNNSHHGFDNFKHRTIDWQYFFSGRIIFLVAYI